MGGGMEVEGWRGEGMREWKGGGMKGWRKGGGEGVEGRDIRSRKVI